jgi:ATP-dependent Clp protease ATP-binding subunit ClpA
MFIGPSGHGKTELARRLGFLLSLDLHVSDCTIVSRETELFGPRKPFIGAEEGAPLNNFLARKSGEKSIIFLDEFEKATPDIWNALLIPFDKGLNPSPLLFPMTLTFKGEYQDRRNLKTVDCSKTIWIIATNALDEKIENFCKRNPKIFEEDDQEEREGLLESLNEAMKEEFKGQFKVSNTSS